MGLSRSQGITRYNRPWLAAGPGLEYGSAYQESLKQMGDSFNTFSLNNSSYGRMKNQDRFGIPEYTPRYSYNADTIKSQLNVDAATDVADKLKKYGDKLFDVFDRYQDNFNYLGENATVTDAQLQSRLGTAASDFSAQQDIQQSEYERDMQRMGINPNSAKFAGFGTSNALHKAAGLSALQNQVRDQARSESWNRNLDVAELGLDAGNAGAGAVGQAANVYKLSGDLFMDNKIKYDQLNESARQHDNNYRFQQDQMKLSAQNQAFNQGQQRFTNGLVQKYQNNGTSLYQESFGYGY